jgi:hypothetical protein
MTVETEITMKDFEAFRDFILRRGQGRTFVIYLVGGLFVGFFGMFAVRASHVPFHGPSFIGAVVLFCAFYVVYRRFALRRFRPSEGGPLIGKKTYTVTPDNFVEQSQFSKSEMSLRIVKSIIETNEHIFLMIDKHSAYIVPKRDFTDSVAQQTFLGPFLAAGIELKNA